MHSRPDHGPRWTVEWHDFHREPAGSDDLPDASALRELTLSNGGADGLPVYIGPNGVIDVRLLRYLRSRQFGGLAQTSRERYVSSQIVWLNFLIRVGRNWDEVEESDIASYMDWRLLEPESPARVSEDTYKVDKAALVHLYRWASKNANVKPPLRVEDINASSPSRGDVVEAQLELDLDPSGQNATNVRWLTPGAYGQWRDLGLRGFGADLLPPTGKGLATEDRNHAFADGMYGSGCRRQEWASLLTLELPPVDNTRRYQRITLGREVAKGDTSYRKVLVERRDLARIHAYADEGSRRDAVRRGQQRGLYDDVPGRIEVFEHNPQTRKVRTNVRRGWVSLDEFTVTDRRRMFWRGTTGWEPLQLWLTQSGKPMGLGRWNRLFEDANARVARTLRAHGVEHSGLWCTPHMLRHSYAFRWFCFFETTYHLRLEHLSAEERRDYRSQFGDTWFLISTLLRHKDPATTKNYYLVPFQEAHVDAMLALMDQDERTALSERLSAASQDDPRVLAAVDLMSNGTAR